MCVESAIAHNTCGTISRAYNFEIWEVGELRGVQYWFGVTVLLVTAASFCGATTTQSVSITDSGKLFALSVSDNEFPTLEIASHYEKSPATAVMITVNWEKCLPSDPGDSPPKYDFSCFDNHPAAKSTKTRIVRIDLRNSWANKIRSSNPEAYGRLVESFVRELVKHVGSFGVKHFVYRVELTPEQVEFYTQQESVEALKRVYAAAKSVMPGSTIIAEQSSGTGGNAVAKVYHAGAKGNFDAVAIPAVTNPCEPVDMFQVIAARRELVRNGDESKKLLILGGCVTSADSSVSWQTLRQVFQSDVRNILTDRDIYDPEWLLGEVFYLPKIPSADFLTAIPSSIPAVTLTAQLTAEDPIFNYVTETPYKLVLTLNNETQTEIKIDDISIKLRGDSDMAVESKPDGQVPTAVAPGGTSASTFTITLPKECAGRQVTLVCTVAYSLAGSSYSVDAWLSMIPTPQYEITILPFRLILDPRKEAGEQVGMSVINHTRDLFEGKITLDPYKGIKVRPTEFATKIDPLGLEGFAFNVSADKDIPAGHYAIFVDVAGKAKEWQAVDVPLLLRKTSTTIAVDGTLEDWQEGIGSFTLVSTGDRQPLGKGVLTYDESHLFIAVELSTPTEVTAKSAVASMLIGVDPLIDGARAASGGYRDDDYEFELFVDKRTGPVVRRNQAPSGKGAIVKSAKFVLRTGEKGSVYEAAIPWTELQPIQPTKDSFFAMSILVKLDENAGAEWGGGLGLNKDPRLFLPVILTE